MENKPFIERVLGAVLTGTVIVLDTIALAVLPPDAKLLGISIWKILVAITAVAALVLGHGYHRENRALRKRVDQSGLSIVQQFRQIHDHMIALKDCWEGDYPAGPAAWRNESDTAAKRAERLLREHFSSKEANQFAHLTWRDWKDQPETDYGESEEYQRIALLLARAKFLYPYGTE